MKPDEVTAIINRDLDEDAWARQKEEKIAFKGKNLAEIFIVSSCAFGAPEENALEVGNGTNFPGLTVGVSEAKGEKCPRCWMHSEAANAEGLCPRCASVISRMEIEL